MCTVESRVVAVPGNSSEREVSRQHDDFENGPVVPKSWRLRLRLATSATTGDFGYDWRLRLRLVTSATTGYATIALSLGTRFEVIEPAG
jgi:hypothetical protein